MSITRYRSIQEMPRPWRDPLDAGNLRHVARMLALYHSLTKEAPCHHPCVRRFRTLQEANAGRNDPYRR